MWCVARINVFILVGDVGQLPVCGLSACGCCVLASCSVQLSGDSCRPCFGTILLGDTALDYVLAYSGLTLVQFCTLYGNATHIANTVMGRYSEGSIFRRFRIPGNETTTLTWTLTRNLRNIELRFFGISSSYCQYKVQHHTSQKIWELGPH